ncbi:MAG: HEAT repeat domain-containing protein [Acidobacteriales bacterium]|nr:HEAT repeat domain-containing protein [Terriglobales bacterium]
MFFLEDLSSLAIWLIALVMSLNLLFLFFVLYRRLARQRYFAEKDAARSRYRPSIDDFIFQETPVETTAEVLNTAKSLPERDAVYELLVKNLSEETAPRISKLMFALGFVEQWARQAFGKKRAKELMKRSLAGVHEPLTKVPQTGFTTLIPRLRVLAIPRAIAVDSLGKLAPKYAHVFLAEALTDPATWVRRLAVENMGRNRFPEAIPMLVHELRKAVEEQNDVSLRSMKAALVCYRLEDLEFFIPFLTQANRRARFFVIDTLREICNKASRTNLLTKNDFSPTLCKVVLESCVKDEFEDVRARCTYVIRHFRDEAATAALRQLMSDPNEFVRMHTVRACANRYYVDLIPDVVARMTDVRWRVREAAVVTLAALGPRGREEMYRYFADCSDRFACEQITEELQRKGLIPDLVANVAQGGGVSLLAQAVIRKVVSLGKTSLLLGQMMRVESPEARLFLMDTLFGSPTEEYITILQEISFNSSGNVQSKSRQLLRRLGVPTLDSSSGIEFPSGSGASLLGPTPGSASSIGLRSGYTSGPRLPSSGSGVRTPSSSGVRTPSTSGARPPSSSGTRPPSSSSGARPPSSSGMRPPSSSGARPPSSSDVRPPSSSGQRPPSSSDVRPPSSSGQRPPSSSGQQPPSASGADLPSVSDMPTEIRPPSAPEKPKSEDEPKKGPGSNEGGQD